MLLTGDAYATQIATSVPAAMTQAAPAATSPKAATTAKTPAKKTGTAAKSAAAAPALTTRTQKFSYALGMNIGTGLGANLKKQSVEGDSNLVSQGLKNAMSGGKQRLTEENPKPLPTDAQPALHKPPD